MILDPSQRAKVAQWIQEGAKLSEIQKKLATEFGASLTYMEVRFLVDDLKLTPKDVERPKPAPLLAGASANPASQPAAAAAHPGLEPEPPTGGLGSVKLSVDQLTRPGAMASGKVTFRDGKTGQWYFDNSGRLGLVPPEPGYQPAPADLQEFQVALEAELSRLGM